MPNPDPWFWWFLLFAGYGAVVFLIGFAFGVAVANEVAQKRIDNAREGGNDGVA